MIGALIAKKKLAAAFNAMNAHDLSNFMTAWRDDATFVYPGEIPQSGSFKGRAAIEAWFRGFFAQFPEIGFDVHDICVDNIFDLIGTNTVTVHWDVRLKNREGRVGFNSGVTVLQIVHGKAVFVQDFIFDLGENFRLNWSAPTAAAAPEPALV